jgi:hypothetical protein
MRQVDVWNTTRGVLLARAEVAESFWERGRGLLGRDGLAPGTGMLIVGATCVHSFWMRFTIDVLHVDRKGVARAQRTVRPNRLGPWHPFTDYVLELPDGTLAATGTQRGDRITLDWACAGTLPAPVQGAARPAASS